MPEGDTIFRAARTMHRALAGRAVVRFESVFPALNRIDADHPLAGRTIESVSSRGKHLLMAFSGDLVLHTHMRMNGSWHLYRPGERWRRPRRDLRLLVATDAFEAVGFNVPVAELLSGRDLARHEQLGALGPDLLDPAFDRAEAIRRMRAHPHDAAADVLLNQRVAAGIGNVLKSEVLFVAGIDPFTPIERLGDERLEALIDVARRLLAASVLGRAETLSVAIGRRTTRSLDPQAKLWVYGRGGRPCRKCGAAIQVRATGTDARLTYWCARCQTPA
jgi:endonuclease-8